MIPSAKATTRAETPMAFIRAMVHAYTLRGLDPSRALAKAQIAPNLLNQANARVTALQMEWMSEAAMRELDDEALGWFRRRLPWGSYGMLVRASLTSPDLGVALQRWCRHHNLLTDDIGLQVAVDKGTASIELQELHDLSRMHPLDSIRCWDRASNGATVLPLREVELLFVVPKA